MTLREAAEHYKKNFATLKDACRLGRLEYVMVEGRRHVTAEAMEAYIQGRRTNAVDSDRIEWRSECLGCCNVELGSWGGRCGVWRHPKQAPTDDSGDCRTWDRRTLG